jgi:hypothetical protein
VGWKVTVSFMLDRAGMVTDGTLGVNSGRSQVIEEITRGALPRFFTSTCSERLAPMNSEPNASRPGGPG